MPLWGDGYGSSAHRWTASGISCESIQLVQEKVDGQRRRLECRLGQPVKKGRGLGIVGQVRHTLKPRPEKNLVFYLVAIIDCGGFETQPWVH